MRLPTSIRGKKRERSDAQSHSRKRSSGGGLFRKVVLAAGLLGLAYVIKRRRGEGGAGPMAGESREPARKERDIPINGTPSDESTERADEGQADEPPFGEDRSEFEEGGPGLDENESTLGEDESTLGEEPSPEEIIERAEQDIQEKPAEPGEMTVDEEVAENLVDEESGEVDTAEPDDTEEVEPDTEDDEESADTEDEESE